MKSSGGEDSEKKKNFTLDILVLERQLRRKMIER